MKMACALTLTIFSLLWLVHWIWLSSAFDPPVTWWVPPLAALLTTAAVGALRNGEHMRRDAARLSAALQGDLPIDGKFVGVIGTIHPVADPLTAPLSGRACVICQYSVQAQGLARIKDSKGKTATSRITPELFYGYLQTESVIRTQAGSLRLLAYPDLTGIPLGSVHDPNSLARAREYVQASRPEHVVAKSIGDRVDFVHDLATTDTGAVKRDCREVSDTFLELLFAGGGQDSGRKRRKARNTEAERWTRAVLNDIEFVDDVEFDCQEKLIVPGTQVCAVGQYCAERNALTHGLGRYARACHLWTDKPEKVHRQLQAQSRRNQVGGLIGLIVIQAVLLGATLYAPHDAELRASRGAKMLAAAEAGELESVRHWLERGADPNARDAGERTALWLTKSPQIARLLIDSGADVNAIGDSQYDERVLHEACRQGRVQIIDLLIQAGAQLDVRNSLGQTPLMEAARYGELEAARRLIASGADLNLRSARDNSTALGQARRDDKHDLVALLRSVNAEDDLVTAENGVAIEDAAHPAVVACREYLRACFSADVQKVAGLYSSRTAIDDLKTMDWPEHRKMWPGDIQEVTGFVRGDDATLTIVGPTESGTAVPCEYQLLRENGEWKIVRGRIL